MASEAVRSVTGSRVFVTGAASGIGRATALLFASQGAIVAVSDTNGDRLESVVKDGGGRVHPFRLDVTDPLQVSAIIDVAATALGGLDVLINNAGISALTPIDDAAYDEAWSHHIAVLLTAQQRTVRAALPYLRASAAPRIINIASTEALGATAQLSAYAAAKAGVLGLTRALAVELGREGITVNCICPGPVETGMTQAISRDDKRRFANRRTALRRYGSPEEIAHMILSIALPAASYLTGAIIAVDGGLTARNA